MVPTPGPLDIVYEDGDLLVLNKAPGVTVHPGPGHYADTLCNFIAYYYRERGITADVHPVQRLDRGTSGLMVVAKHPHAQERLKRVDPAGQAAVTRYRVLRTGRGRALVELELDTGRTHQIRVHMAHIGHPLTGDFLYGTEAHSLISRPALHSARLSLLHPVTGARMAWEQPLPEDMKRLI